MYTLTCIPVMVTFDVVKNPSTENTAGQTCQFPKVRLQRPRGEIIEKRTLPLTSTRPFCAVDTCFIYIAACAELLCLYNMCQVLIQTMFSYLLEAISGVYSSQCVFASTERNISARAGAKDKLKLFVQLITASLDTIVFCCSVSFSL